MAAVSLDPSDTPLLVNPNPQLQTYYHSLESRIGYRLLLGGTRHFGYWNRDTYWPLPLSTSLRAMEDKLAEALALPRGAHVLDAGCGVGHVALRMAQVHGLRISGIDIIDHHITKARRNIKRSGLLNNAITVRKMDYHHLESLPDESLDGAYTMETFVHATDPEAVLAGFYRLLRPGGRVAHFEYDHDFVDSAPEDMAASMRKINQYAAMPTNHRSHPGVFKQMLEEAGFEDVVVRDFSENIKPMTRLLFVLAIVPYVFVRLLGLERYFINTIAGVESYRGRGRWRYVAITATKPGGPLELAKAR
ncbi:S-adenosyl-L-methionine-dependent methyltransferase [Lasiosphaeria ovina]|uniref:S-adenosyl-L-methionine-dependent methyltransferase n=1 Tax=Lasiosphaeria ovina TaxID=92902 RepID=A0AAE0N4U8_9PEZI|nr:S-adenosyl-L-methionine-dependent methyltransferase [Lasiosphaeria ovina]